MLNGPHSKKFLSTLSLRRATAKHTNLPNIISISIHALLAESDFFLFMVYSMFVYFYPRSPCGERPRGEHHANSQQEFLSTLSLRRATRANRFSHAPPEISIHALLAESDVSTTIITICIAQISIHALLAESDRQETHQWPGGLHHFYPRSPCGERLRVLDGSKSSIKISIHALLAESDVSFA